MPEPQAERSQRWVWWICGLLLLASTINYMDRQTLVGTSDQITSEFGLNKEQYGYVEAAFGLAFAVGASIFGVISDRTNVRWLYPCVLLLWSVMGFATGLIETYTGLLLCRMFLGLFEAGHWPCALKTTQRLLPAKYRALAGMLLTVSPFYHYNTANFGGGPLDTPISTTDERTSQYGGAQATLSVEIAKNNLQVGFYGFHQQDNQLFGLVFNDGSNHCCDFLHYRG